MLSLSDCLSRIKRAPHDVIHRTIEHHTAQRYTVMVYEPTSSLNDVKVATLPKHSSEDLSHTHRVTKSMCSSLYWPEVE